MRLHLRTRALYSLGVVVATALVVPGAPAQAGSQASLVDAHAGQLAAGGPQFLLMSGHSLMPLDVSRTPALARRLTIDFDSVPARDALRAIARQAGFQLLFSDQVVPDRPVRLQASGISVAAALTDVLLDAGVDVVLTPTGAVSLVRRAVPAPGPNADDGTITGTVREAKSGHGVPGVTVYVDGTKRGSITSEEGAYSIRNVPSGRQQVTAKALGFRKLTQSVTVSSGKVTLDFSLEVVAAELSEVVVSGALVAMPAGELTHPISVVTAEEIVARAATDLPDILRTVPGISMPAYGSRDDYQNYRVRGSSSTDLSPIKMYIDGVEVTEPTYMSYLDPNMVDHVEVLTGPQGVTLYGAEATNGVLQIFTKKGDFNIPSPQLDVKVSAGELRSHNGYGADSTFYVPVTSNNLNIRGGGQDASFNVGASYASTASWIPDPNYKGTFAPQGTDGNQQIGVNGSLRMKAGPVVAEFTGRTLRNNFSVGYPPLYPEWERSGYVNAGGYFVTPYVEVHQQNHDMFGVNLKYAATDKWSHTLTLGVDRDEINWWYPGRRDFPADTFTFVYDATTFKPSLHYNTAYETALDPDWTASLVGGFDEYTYQAVGAQTQAALGTNVNSGNLVNTSNNSTTFTRLGYENRGFLSAVRLGYHDQLFLNGGLRLDNNTSYGSNVPYSYSPTAGAAYVLQPNADWSVKLRGGWGRAIKPPGLNDKLGQPPTRNVQILANPDLGPETNSGSEFGVDLNWRNKYSLQTTYYDQTTSNLVYEVRTTAPSLTLQQFQYQNVGVINNKGFELAGRAQFGRIRLNATYSPVMSKIISLSNTTDPDLGSFLGKAPPLTPNATGSLTATWEDRSNTITYGVEYTGHWVSYDADAMARAEAGNNTTGNLGNSWDYYMQYPNIYRFLLTASHRFNSTYQVFTEIRNLSDNVATEYTYIERVKGRQVSLGFRAHY